MLVLGLERRPDHTGRRVVDEHVEWAERRDLVEDTLRGDVATDERHLGAERAQLLGRLLGGAVVPQVADRDPLRAVAREAQCDRAADPARPARDEDVHLGSGSSARADDGISFQPSRVGASRGPSSAFDEA